jgi:hypothetical protein
MGIIPGGMRYGFVTNANGVVGSLSFPFTEGRVRCRLKILLFDVLRWNVVDRRMAGLQDTFGTTSVGNDDAVADDLNMFVAVL